MKSADVISNNMNPRTTYNGSADMTAVVSTIQDGMVQWLVAADRDTNNYDPNGAIPIGEMQYDRRMVNVWASSDSRIITQYLTMLRTYNLYPKPETLIGILKNFGHIASNGLISIPKFGADTQAIDNKKKGLIGTLFAASWYTRNNQDSLVASLDDDKARLWLQDSRFGNERADLVGLKYIAETNTLLIQPIEVKTRDESPDATNIGGKDAVCYIPSSCRLSNFIDMTGRTVLLRPIETPNTRTAYAVYAVKYRKGFILLNLAQTNRVIEAQIRRRYFSFLGVRKKISHEYKIGNYKADLFIHDTNTLIEIKSTLSFSKKSTFPTVYSERAVKQLTEISRLLDEGYRACYILVSLNPSVKEITINSEIEDYYKEFMKCIEKGMTYCAFSIRLHEQTPELYAKIKITI